MPDGTKLPPPNGKHLHRLRAAEITPESVVIVAEAVALGLSIGEACKSAGIAENLYATAVSATSPNPELRDLHTKSVVDTRLAWLRAIAAGAKGWQSLAWLMERVDPRFGRPQQQLSPRAAGRLLDALRQPARRKVTVSVTPALPPPIDVQPEPVPVPTE